MFKRFSKLFGFTIASDKASEASRRRYLEPSPRNTSAGNFVDLNGFSHPFHGYRTERFHLHVAFG